MTELPQETTDQAPMRGPSGWAGRLWRRWTWVPKEVAFELTASGLQSLWLLVYLNLAIALLVGILQITSDQPLTPAFWSFVARCGASMVASGLLLPVALGGRAGVARRPVLSRAALIAADALILGVAGLSALPHVSAIDYEENAQLVVALGGAASISAILAPRVALALPLGRLLILAPVTIWLIAAKPPAWGLLLGFAAFALAVAMAIAIWVYRQALRAADTAVRLRAADAESRQLALRLSDTLESERAGAEKIRAEALLRERFVHAVTHDLRQSLSALRLHTESAAQGNGDIDGLTRVVRDGLASADATIESVAQAAWLAESAPPKLSAVPLGPVLQALASEAAPVLTRASLELRVVDTSLTVRVDPTVLERALRNLLHNAAHHSRGRRVVMGARRQGAEVAVIVADDGRGIPPQRQADVFRRFVQLENEAPAMGSVGLGLATVKELIERTGGTVTLRSEEGRGTCFALRLPRAAPPRALSRRGRILVMDDDPESRAALAEAARALGWHPIQCDGPHAAARAGPVDAYLFDFFLGERATALDVLAGFDLDQAWRTLVVSRHIPQTFARRVAATGASVGSKPLSQARLAAFLASLEDPADAEPHQP